MNKIITFLFFVCLLIACQTDEVLNVKGSLSFSFTSKNRSELRTNELTTPAFVLLIIKNLSGEVLIEYKKLALFSFGQGFVSENVELPVGSYQVTQFIILDTNHKAIFATPYENSELANLVADPLPINFSVTENNTNTITPQVIPIEPTDTPELFGYANFGFEIVDNNSQLIKEYEIFSFKSHLNKYIPEEKHVFTYTNGKLTKKDYYYYLPEYKLYYQHYHEIFEYNLEGKLSKVTFYNTLYNNNIIWKYILNYPTNNTVEWNWLTILSGYPDEIYFTYLFTRTNNNYSMDITQFPGKTSQSKYFFDGYFDQNNNLIGKNDYYLSTPASNLSIANFDSNPNPLKSIHEFFKTEMVVAASDNNPLLLRYESVDKTSSYQMEYSYEYNHSNYPSKCYLVLKTNDNITSKSMMTFKY